MSDFDVADMIPVLLSNDGGNDDSDDKKPDRKPKNPCGCVILLVLILSPAIAGFVAVLLMECF